MKLGYTSTTGISREIIATNSSVRVPKLVDVEKVVEKFMGETEQTVPVYSAVKINGQKSL